MNYSWREPMELKDVNTIRITIEFGELRSEEQIESVVDGVENMKDVPVFREFIKVDSMIPLTKSIAGTLEMFSPVILRICLTKVHQMFVALWEKYKIAKPLIIPSSNLDNIH